MADQNVVLMTGHVGTVDELKFVGGNACLNFQLASNAKWRAADGELRTRTTWIRCALWGKRAQALAPLLRVGAHVLVRGQLRHRDAETSSGKHRFHELALDDLELFDRRKPQNPA